MPSPLNLHDIFQFHGLRALIGQEATFRDACRAIDSDVRRPLKVLLRRAFNSVHYSFALQFRCTQTKWIFEGDRIDRVGVNELSHANCAVFCHFFHSKYKPCRHFLREVLTHHVLCRSLQHQKLNGNRYVTLQVHT